MSTPSLPVAFITGVSSGIGRATALKLKTSGYEVFGTSRRVDTGSIVDGIQMVQLDVGDDSSVEKAVAFVMKQTGRIDLLVNNAGFGIFGGAEESSIAQAKDLFETNLFGVIRTVRAVLPIMRKQKNGRIINVSSVLGFVPSPYMALYAASKHALEGYSQSLDHEIRTFGVRVLLVEPAYTKTSFEQNMQASDELMPEYEKIRTAIGELIAGAMATADDPYIVADEIAKAAAAISPKLRYPAGAVARRLNWLRRLVPASSFDRGLRKRMQLAS
ncbi:oxidoreductase [Phyllobacterium sp. SB3]|uniref:oxidoreductase n=1 Tax=Phyllobacterium sp. SB3 TaxID=3156073 RepID=UPI0032AFC77F